MELNLFLYRAPTPSYSCSSFKDELVWIPGNKGIKIPCLYLESRGKSSKTFLYFHANAEDLGRIYNFLDLMRCVLNVNVIAPEYPGYGIYKGEASTNSILTDGLVVYKFLRQTLKLDVNHLFIIGRSIGTGPASWLATQGSGALILLSAYTSIRKVVRGVFGRLLQYFVKDQFKNIEYMSKVKCPTLFIHGQKDTLISCKHSYKLASVCSGKITVHIPENMTHNEFQYYEDIILPISYFMRENELENAEVRPLRIPIEFFEVPAEELLEE